MWISSTAHGIQPRFQGKITGKLHPLSPAQPPFRSGIYFTHMAALVRPQRHPLSIFAENPIARADRTLYRQSVVAITVPAPKNPFAKFQLGLVSRAIEDGENVGIVGGSEDGTLTILTGRALNKAARNQNRARDDEFYKTGH